MKKIPVRILPPTKSNRVYYFPDPEIEQHILYIRRNVVEKAAYVINLDGIVFILLDNNSILESLECICGRTSWKIQNNITIPTNITEADVEFTGISKGMYKELPVTVLTDQNYSYAQVLIGDIEPTYEWIALSTQCYVLLSRNNFHGYFVKLIE